MTTNRDEYQKQYVKQNIEKIRTYKREWNRNKRHPELRMIEINQPIIDPRAKKQCILCLDFIDQDSYLLRGNYCTRCNTACDHLSKLYPYTNTGNHSDEEEYKERLENKLRWYTKEMDNFQFFLKENRKRMKKYVENIEENE